MYSNARVCAPLTLLLSDGRGGAANSRVSVSDSLLTTNRVYQMPDASGTVPLLSLSQTFTAAQTFEASTAGKLVNFNRTTDSVQADVSWRTGGVLRWDLRFQTAETGSNAGGDLALIARSDAGAAIDTPLTIGRAAASPFTLGRPVIITSSGSLVVGTSAFIGSERARIAGGTIATPTSTDVVIGGGSLSAGATVTCVGLVATGVATLGSASTGGHTLTANTSHTLIRTDANTATVNQSLALIKRTTGTAANGYGTNWIIQLASSNGTDRAAANMEASWVDATDATRKSRVRFEASDAAGQREFLRGEAFGAAAGVSLLGASATSGTVTAAGAILSNTTGGVGYTTGAGGTVTQITSRTTGVTLNTATGAITLVSAAGSASWQSFTVTNSAVAATDTVILNQVSGTDLYMLSVTAVAAGSFRISFATTGGTTTEQPVFRFTVIKSVSA